MWPHEARAFGPGGLSAPGAPPAPVASTKIAPTANAGPIDVGLAGRQSFGFFYDVTDEHWDLLRRIYLEHANHLDPERPLKFNPENEDRRGIETWGDPEMFSSYKAWYQSVSEPKSGRVFVCDAV